MSREECSDVQFPSMPEISRMKMIGKNARNRSPNPNRLITEIQITLLLIAELLTNCQTVVHQLPKMTGEHYRRKEKCPNGAG